MSYKLTPKDKITIQQFIQEGRSDPKIAEFFNVSSQTIANFRKSLGIKKTPNGKLIIDENSPSGMVIEAAKRQHIDQHQKRLLFKKHFLTTSRYKKLVTQYTGAQLEEFTEKWIDYHFQLEDMTTAEEDMLELLLLTKIRIDANQMSFLETEKAELEFKNQLDKFENKELDVENEAQRVLYEMIMSNNRLKQEINKDLKDLTDKYERLQRNLNVSREQREQKQKVGADTFLTIIRQMNDRDKRTQIGRWNELVKISTENQLKKLKEPHRFMDGTEEPIILDGSDYVKKLQQVPESLPEKKDTKTS